VVEHPGLGSERHVRLGRIGGVQSEMPDDRFPAMSYWARATLTIAGVLVMLATAWSVRNILLLVLVAAVIAVGLDPQVRWLQRRRLSRAWAVTIILLLSLGFLALFAWLVIPQAVRQINELARTDYLDRLQHATGFLGTLEAKFDLAERLREASAKIPDLALGKIPSITEGAGSVIFNLLTITVLAVYFLLGLERSHEAAKALVSGRHADRNVRILDESVERIGGYVSGNILISVIAGTLAFIVLEILGVPYAAALAVWVAIADLIPGVGAMLGAVVCVIVALFSSVGDGIAVAVYFTVYQRIENYLILPRVMGKAIDLSAPTVIITLLIGSSLAGLGGALIALPIVAALKVVIREVRPSIFRHSANASRPPASDDAQSSTPDVPPGSPAS
jgi:predicted PurR-regulated permease PerM